jgi:FtsZ-binding cell division protein ZapB
MDSSTLQTIRATVISNHEALMYHEDLILENGRIIMLNGKQLLDQFDSVSFDLLSEIRKGTAKVYARVGSAVEEIRVDIGEVKDLVQEGNRLILTTIVDQAEQTREVVRVEAEGIKIEIRESEERLSVQMGQMQDILQAELVILGDDMDRFEQRMESLSTRFSEGGNGFDDDSDDNLDLFEIMNMLEDTGTVGRSAKAVWDLARTMLVSETQQARKLFTGTQKRPSVVPSSRQQAFIEGAVDLLGRRNAQAPGWQALTTIAGWDKDGNGKIGAADIVTVLSDRALDDVLDDEGRLLWEVYKTGAGVTENDDGLMALSEFARLSESALGSPMGEWILAKLPKDISKAIKVLPGFIQTIQPIASNAGTALASCTASASLLGGNLWALLAVPTCFNSLSDTTRGFSENYDKLKNGVTQLTEGAKKLAKKVGGVGKKLWGWAKKSWGRWLLADEDLLMLPPEYEDLLQWAQDAEYMDAALDNTLLVSFVEEAVEQGNELPEALLKASAEADLRITVPPERMKESMALVASRLKKVTASEEAAFVDTMLATTVDATNADALWDQSRKRLEFTKTMVDLQHLTGARAVNGTIDTTTCSSYNTATAVQQATTALSATLLEHRMREEYIPFLDQQLQTTRYLVIEYMYVPILLHTGTSTTCT